MGFAVHGGSSKSWEAGDFEFLIYHIACYFLVGSQQDGTEDGLDSTQPMSEEGMIIVMYLYEQMVLHSPAQKVLEEQKVMSVFVQKLG